MSTEISVEMHIPLAWVETPMDAIDGALLLRVLDQMEAAPSHYEDDGGEESLRWQAMEARIDLCLQLLGQLLAKDAPRTQPTVVCLSGVGARWRASMPLNIGQSGNLLLYLSRRIPQPLVLPATVVHCAADGAGWQVHVHFSMLDEEFQDWLDKTVFRYHRRYISQLKRQHDDLA